VQSYDHLWQDAVRRQARAAADALRVPEGATFAPRLHAPRARVLAAPGAAASVADRRARTWRVLPAVAPEVQCRATPGVPGAAAARTTARVQACRAALPGLYTMDATAQTRPCAPGGGRNGQQLSGPYTSEPGPKRRLHKLKARSDARAAAAAAEAEHPRDPATGRPLFAPATGRAPVHERNHAGVPIGEYLYRMQCVAPPPSAGSGIGTGRKNSLCPQGI